MVASGRNDSTPARVGRYLAGRHQLVPSLATVYVRNPANAAYFASAAEISGVSSIFIFGEEAPASLNLLQLFYKTPKFHQKGDRERGSNQDEIVVS
jgi:hypothetical protein